MKKEVKQEIDQWCYKLKVNLNKIEAERLEELSQWDHFSDQTLYEDKQFIDKMTKEYTRDNYLVLEYLEEVPLDDLTDAYTKSKNNKYEPGPQKDTGNFISNMLSKVIQNQNLEEERD